MSEAATVQSKVRYIANTENFSKIPGSPIIYNFSSSFFLIYETSPILSQVGLTRLGMTTANNDLFVRYWYEICVRKCNFHATQEEGVRKDKWVPYNKGGNARKWYGNLDCVVDWENNGYAIKHYGEKEGHIRSTVPNTEYYFLECGTWSKVSSGKFAMRYRPNGSIFDVAGACLFTKSRGRLFRLLSFMNSCVAKYMLESLSPTMNFEGGQISNLPIANKVFDLADDVTQSILENISLSKSDWDSYETSWDFKKHPLI